MLKIAAIAWHIFAIAVFVALVSLDLSERDGDEGPEQGGEYEYVPGTYYYQAPGTITVIQAPAPPLAGRAAQNAQDQQGSGESLLEYFFLSNFWIAIFTAASVGTGIALWRLNKEQFGITYRPHLIVRNVWSPAAAPGDEIAIEFEVINIGTADAIIDASAFETYLVSENDSFHTRPLTKVGNPPMNFMGRVVIRPSAVWRGKPFKPGWKWTTHHFHDTVSKDAGYFWSGKILYRDKAGRPRRLGVFRRLDPPTRRFRPVGDPEYEYDD